MRRERGFTVAEILVALTVLIIAALAAMAIRSRAVELNVHARRLDRANELARDLLEILRTVDLSQPPTKTPFELKSCSDDPTTTPCLADIVVDKVVYKRKVKGVPGSGVFMYPAGIMLIESTVSFDLDPGAAEDDKNTVTAHYYMLRTRNVDGAAQDQL